MGEEEGKKLFQFKIDNIINRHKIIRGKVNSTLGKRFEKE